MLIIINLSIILTLLVIVLFDIVSTEQQIYVCVMSLLAMILFKYVFDIIIVKNKTNKSVNNIFNVRNDNSLKNDSAIHNKTCNSFDLKYLHLILKDLKNIRVGENGKNRYEQNVKHIAESGNKDFHFKDLHNTEEKITGKQEDILLKNNTDCTNDISWVIEKSIYNFHKT